MRRESMYLYHIKAEFKVIPLFYCTDCCAVAQGKTMRFEIEASRMDNFITKLKDKPVDVDCMPVGWSNNDTGIKCAAHTGKLAGIPGYVE